MTRKDVIFKRDDIKITLETTDLFEGVKITIEMDKPEAKGTIILEESTYGLWLSSPQVDGSGENPLALVDLLYNSEEGAGCPDPVPVQLLFYSPAQTEEDMGRVRFFPNGTQVEFETFVQSRTTRKGLLWSTVFVVDTDSV